MRKTHFLLPCQFCFARLSLVRITPFRWYHPNILIRRGSFNFQRLSLLFLSIGMFGWFNALYIEPIEIVPFSCRFQQNSSGTSCKWTFAKHWSKAFQDASRGPNRSLKNFTFGGELSITLAMVSPLWQTILCNVGYYSRRVVVPSHLSSQNLIYEPSLMENLRRRKVWLFVAISPAPECDSLGF
jgi:hypothetical protein